MLTERQIWIPVVLALAIGAVPAQAEIIQVTIDRLLFSPAEINAKVGDTIEWINKDAFAHTSTVKGGWEVLLPPKKTTTQILQAAELVDYYCRFHPNMKGRLTVTVP